MNTNNAESILDWFDVDNIIHLKAFKHLCQHGVWLRGFIPSRIYFPANWQVSLAFKLATRYINFMIDGC